MLSMMYLDCGVQLRPKYFKVQTHVTGEREKKGFDGRVGAVLPRISDGSFLFLQHMIAKMKRDNGGSRIAIVFNGSPLFSGSAGSGESDIRRE
jgi:type I restriction enzyme M protein